jgi:hypothetical protein
MKGGEFLTKNIRESDFDRRKSELARPKSEGNPNQTNSIVTDHESFPKVNPRSHNKIWKTQN